MSAAAERGEVDWATDGDILALQWMDSKTVYILTSIYYEIAELLDNGTAKRNLDSGASAGSNAFAGGPLQRKHGWL